MKLLILTFALLQILSMANSSPYSLGYKPVLPFYFNPRPYPEPFIRPDNPDGTWTSTSSSSSTINSDSSANNTTVDIRFKPTTSPSSNTPSSTPSTTSGTDVSLEYKPMRPPFYPDPKPYPSPITTITPIQRETTVIDRFQTNGPNIQVTPTQPSAINLGYASHRPFYYPDGRPYPEPTVQPSPQSNPDVITSAVTDRFNPSNINKQTTTQSFVTNEATVGTILSELSTLQPTVVDSVVDSVTKLSDIITNNFQQTVSSVKGDDTLNYVPTRPTFYPDGKPYPQTITLISTQVPSDLPKENFLLDLITKLNTNTIRTTLGALTENLCSTTNNYAQDNTAKIPSILTDKVPEIPAQTNINDFPILISIIPIAIDSTRKEITPLPTSLPTLPTKSDENESIIDTVTRSGNDIPNILQQEIKPSDLLTIPEQTSIPVVQRIENTLWTSNPITGNLQTSAPSLQLSNSAGSSNTQFSQSALMTSSSLINNGNLQTSAPNLQLSNVAGSSNTQSTLFTSNPLVTNEINAPTTPTPTNPPTVLPNDPFTSKLTMNTSTTTTITPSTTPVNTNQLIDNRLGTQKPIHLLSNLDEDAIIFPDD